MRVKVKRLYPEASLPTQGSTKAAAYDVYACINNEEGCVVVEPTRPLRLAQVWQ